MTSTARPDGGSENPRQNVTFASDGGSAHGYLATPPSGSGPGVVVVQEWWGLDDHIAEVVDRLAGEGLVALAPDLFGGRVAHDSGEGGRLLEEAPVGPLLRRGRSAEAGAAGAGGGPGAGRRRRLPAAARRRDVVQRRRRGLLHGRWRRPAAGRAAGGEGQRRRAVLRRRPGRAGHVRRPAGRGAGPLRGA